MFDQTQANEAPYLNAGTNALPTLLNGIGAGGGNTTGTGPLNAAYPTEQPFTLANFQNSPGYQFQLQQGENAVLNNASATGGVNSGNTLKALTQFGQGVANQDYWNAYNAYNNQYLQNYNQYTANQNQKFNQLQTITGSGQNAAVNLGTVATNVGQSIGNNITSAGNASAAGQVASGNAITGAISGTANSVSNNFLLSNLLANSGGLNFGGGGTSDASGAVPWFGS